METDLAYYRRRASEESVAAEAALHSKARTIHLDLKRRYEERVTAIAARREDSTLNLVSAA
jgi:hypothetical protein